MSIISTVGGCGWVAYLFATFMHQFLREVGREAPPLLLSIRMELRPFALAFLCAYFLPRFLTKPDPWTISAFVMMLVTWWLVRHDKDDDDRWKRRRRKLAEQVAEVGGRLALVPAANPA